MKTPNWHLLAQHPKTHTLLDILRSMGSVVVAYSGGTDSSFLMACAHHVLGQHALAVTGVSPTLPRQDLEDAVRQAERYGWQHRRVATREFDDPRFTANPPDHCYYCKRALFEQLRAIADTEGFRHVADGSQTDDWGDHRPGARAKAELGIRSPLQEAGFSKEEIRVASRQLGLPTADKPPLACLASRFPIGTPIVPDRTRTVDALETTLRGLGFYQVRVRVHGELARIELDAADLERSMAPEIRAAILDATRQAGFRYTTVDMEGYRMGSMNDPVAAG